MISPGASDSIEAFFLPGTSGRLFSVFHGPLSGPPPSVGVLYIPPFADEMNKSRRQVSLQTRRLAAQGFGTLCVDLYGTGDSEGHFRDARWNLWIEDLLTAVSWLKQRGMQRIILWGVRLGALLAVDLAGKLAGQEVQMILWQPVTSGKQFVGQFLRLRAAAEMMAGDGGLNTTELRAQLQRGELVEIAGYDLHPELASEIEARDLRKMPLAEGTRVDWLEIMSESQQTIPPVAGQVVAAWTAIGVDVEVTAIIGEQFWTTPEIAVVDKLLDKTDQIVGQILPESQQ